MKPRKAPPLSSLPIALHGRLKAAGVADVVVIERLHPSNGPAGTVITLVGCGADKLATAVFVPPYTDGDPGITAPLAENAPLRVPDKLKPGAYHVFFKRRDVGDEVGPFDFVVTRSDPTVFVT